MTNFALRRSPSPRAVSELSHRSGLLTKAINLNLRRREHPCIFPWKKPTKITTKPPELSSENSRNLDTPMNIKKFPPIRLIDLNEKQSPRPHNKLTVSSTSSRQNPISLKMVSTAVPDTSDDINEEIGSPVVRRRPSSCESEMTEFMAHKASADSYHLARQN